MMADRSTKSIAEIRAGDQVLSRSEVGYGHALQPQTVQQRIVKTNVATKILEFASITGAPLGSLETTAEHPFWLRGVGWVSAGSLAVGDLVAAEHGWVEVSSLRAGGTTTVFNLAVDELSTYLVATTQGQWIWVHNECPIDELRRQHQRILNRRKKYEKGGWLQEIMSEPELLRFQK